MGYQAMREDSVLVIDDPLALEVLMHEEQDLGIMAGQFKVLVVLVTDRFGNRPSQSEAQMAHDVFYDNMNLRERYRACSRNKLDFIPATGLRVNHGVITVQTSSHLSGAHYTQCGNLGYAALPGGISAHHIMYICPDNTNFDGAVAWGQAPGQISWYPSQYASFADVQVHELGHNLGFAHSGTSLQQGRQYDDGTCHMSNEGGFKDESRKFCFNAAKYHYSNWFPEFTTSVSPATSSFKGDLVGIDDVVNNRANSQNQDLVVKVHGRGETHLFMMYNRRKGINSEVPEHGDQVVIVAQSALSEVSVRVATLSEGQTYTNTNWANSGNSLKVKFCSKGNNGDVASVLVYLENVNNLICDGGNTESCCNTHQYCDHWARTGECSNYPDYMLRNCREACNNCGCSNDNSSCDSWAAAGFCSGEYANYMLRSCQKSCNNCPVTCNGSTTDLSLEQQNPPLPPLLPSPLNKDSEMELLAEE